MPAANDVRKGQVIKFNGEPHLVMETQHRTPGNLRAFVQIKMRNLRYGKTLEQRFNSPDPVEVGICAVDRARTIGQYVHGSFF